MKNIVFRSTNRRNSFSYAFAAFVMVASPSASADVGSDEEKLFYEIMIKPNFKKFFKKNGRYPSNWIELGEQDSCTGFFPSEKKNFPRPEQSLVWKPRDCELSYKLVFGNRKGFRVVALAKGHVVSVYENFKATYYKTPYHDHGPYGQNPPEGTVY